MDLHEEIRKVAYELYEKSGRRGGRELENWLEAERIVMARSAQEEKSGKAKTAATHQVIKAPPKSRVGKTETHDKGTPQPRTKKTRSQKAAKTSK
jgi:hypothetical protein